MVSLHLQRFVDVVAFPACFLVVDLHVERQRELLVRKYRVKIGRQGLENMFAGLLAGGEVAALAKPQQHVEKGEVAAVCNRIVLAPDGADANASEREDAGL